MIERCREEDWTGLIRRNVHHAFQNGARRVLAVDWEKNRLREGDSYGYYRIQGMNSWQLEEAIGILEKEEKERILELSCGASWYCAVDGGSYFPLNSG